MNKVKLIVLFCGIYSSLICQLPILQKRIYLQKANTMDSRDVIETSPNNYFIIGFTLDSTSGPMQQRLTVAGLDQNGNVIWKKGYGSNKFTYSPYLYTSGMLLRKGNFLYSAMIVNDSNSFQPGVLIKFDLTGDTIWQRKYYPPSTKQLFITCVAPSVDGGFLISGAVQTNSPLFNSHPTVGIYLLKTDSNGNKLWEKEIYKTNLDEAQAGYKLVQDSVTKRIIIVGVQDQGTTNCSNVMLLDSLGAVLKQTNFSGASGGALIDIIKLSDGRFAAVGANTYPQQISSMVTCKSMLVKVDTALNLIYKKEYDTTVVVNVFNNIRELNNGDLLIGGHLETLLQHNLGLNDLLRLIKTDATGNILWKKYYDNYTDNSNQDAMEGMNLTSTGMVIFTSACLSGEAPPRSYTFYRTDTSYCDINALGCYSFAGINSLDKTLKRLTVSPNPSNSVFRVSIISIDPDKRFVCELKNTLGITLHQEPLTSENVIDIEMKGYQAGVYYICISSEKNIEGVRKIILTQ